MPYVGISDDAILRAEPQYFDSYVAFNRRKIQSFSLTREQYAAVHMLGLVTFETSDFAELFDVLTPKHSSATTFGVLLDGNILTSTATEPARRDLFPIPPALSPSALLDDDVPRTSSPAQMEFCITRRCNQTCYHCNVTAYSEAKREKLDIAFWQDVLRQSLEANVLKITITGGEPFVRQGWDEFFEILVEARVGVSILTNGTRIRDDHMAKMARAGHTLSISLDGVTAEQHDRFRRDPGAFDRTMAAMRRLSEHGITFTINTVLHTENVDQADRIFDISKEVGAALVVVAPITAVGRGSSKGAQKYFPTNGAMSAALGRLRQRAINEPGSRFVLADYDERELFEIDTRFAGITQTSRRNPGFCKAGIYSMAVDQDGLAYSCLRGLQTRSFPLGDLKRDSLMSVWNSRRWHPFRDPSLPTVPCRVEHIERQPELYAQ